MFERFYRADKARSRVQKGTGFGLSIAEWIVRKHRGKVRVKTQLGDGTSFVITLPLKPH